MVRAAFVHGGIGVSDIDPLDVPLHSLDDVFRATDADDLLGVENYFELGLHSEIRALDAAAEGYDDGVLLIHWLSGVGTAELFPVTLRECWSDLLDSEADYLTRLNLEQLEQQIQAVEGFNVTIELDEGIERKELLDLVGRRTTLSGQSVQHVGIYPYKRRMGDSATVEQWLTQRFFRRCPGLRVSLSGCSDWLLADIRGADPDAPVMSYGSEDDLTSSPVVIRD
jgi:hypothetical protein